MCVSVWVLLCFIMCVCLVSVPGWFVGRHGTHDEESSSQTTGVAAAMDVNNVTERAAWVGTVGKRAARYTTAETARLRFGFLVHHTSGRAWFSPTNGPRRHKGRHFFKKQKVVATTHDDREGQHPTILTCVYTRRHLSFHWLA
jgi:hypothetical protein